MGRELAALIIPEEFREDHRRALARQPAGAARRGSIGQRLELEALRADGTRFPIELSVSRIDSPDGPFFTAWIRDLTERRQAEEALRHSEAQLRQAQKMEAVGRLAGGVAHDFNNVLTAIFGYADLVLDGFDAGDPRRADVEEIKRAAQPRRGLTRQLLAFSRKQVMQPRRLNLNEIIQNLETLLLKLIGRGDRPARSTPAPSLWDVKADPGQIEQVLMNLAANARDAMPDGGRLTDRHGERGSARRTMRRRWWGSSRARFVRADRRRHRPRHSRTRARAHLRAVLHDQGTGEGDGPRAGDRLRDREAERRLGLPGRDARDPAPRSGSICRESTWGPPDLKVRLLLFFEVRRDREVRRRDARRDLEHLVARRHDRRARLGRFLLHDLLREHAAEAAAAAAAAAAPAPRVS